MSLTTRFQNWNANRQGSTAPTSQYDQMFSDQYAASGVPNTAWPNDWYLGKNLGLERWQALQLVPGVTGAAATILAGGASNGAGSSNVQYLPEQKTDYTPFILGGGLLLAVVLLSKK